MHIETAKTSKYTQISQESQILEKIHPLEKKGMSINLGGLDMEEGARRCLKSFAFDLKQIF